MKCTVSGCPGEYEDRREVTHTVRHLGRVVVIDLARYWLDPQVHIGANLDAMVESTCQVLAAARQVKVPIFFTTWDFDPANPPTPQNAKLKWQVPPGKIDEMFTLDPRLERRPAEKLIKKPSASAFKGTNLHYMLAALHVDTLIVTGISTSHCVYATCRDATDSFQVIVPEECVGERCELPCHPPVNRRCCRHLQRQSRFHRSPMRPRLHPILFYSILVAHCPGQK